jgi:hypothetical protein
MAFLEDLGIDKATFESAKDTTVTKAFELLESGIYKGKVKEVILFKNNFDGTELVINILIEENQRVLSFRSNVSKTKKDGTVNEGFLSRLKSLGLATNFDINNLKAGDKCKVNSYGKECDGQYYLGMNDKPVLACVRKSEDTDRPADDTYRISNDIEGVTTKGSEDEALFLEKVEKLEGATFKWKSGWKPKAGSAAAQASTADSEAKKEELKKMDF